MRVEPLHIIQNNRRRAFLLVLKDLGGEACLREVVRRVAKLEGKPSDTRAFKSIHVSILQTHIPKLERAGIIKYDKTMDTIHLLELPREFRYYLEVVERGDIPWCTYYFILSTFSLLISVIFNNFLAGLMAGCFLAGSIINYIQVCGGVNEALTNVKQALTKYLHRE